MNLTPSVRQRLVALPALFPGAALVSVGIRVVQDFDDDPDWAGLSVLAGLTVAFLVMPVWCLIRPSLTRAVGSLAIVSLTVFMLFGKGLAVIAGGAFQPLGHYAELVRYTISAIVTLALHLGLRRWLAGPPAG